MWAAPYGGQGKDNARGSDPGSIWRMRGVSHRPPAPPEKFGPPPPSASPARVPPVDAKTTVKTLIFAERFKSRHLLRMDWRRRFWGEPEAPPRALGLSRRPGRACTPKPAFCASISCELEQVGSAVAQRSKPAVCGTALAPPPRFPARCGPCRTALSMVSEQLITFPGFGPAYCSHRLLGGALLEAT